MKNALFLLGLAGATPAFAGPPELGRYDVAETMLAVPKGWLIATKKTDDGGIAEVRLSQERLSPVVMLQWGDASGQTADSLIDERVQNLGKQMMVGGASEDGDRESFGSDGRRAKVDAGMMGVSIPIAVAARVVDGKYMTAVFTGPPNAYKELDAPAVVEGMLSRSIWVGEVPPLQPSEMADPSSVEK